LKKKSSRVVSAHAKESEKIETGLKNALQEMVEKMKEEQLKKENAERSRGEKCEKCLIWSINIYFYPLILWFAFNVLLIHACTYRVLDGQIINTGGNNELFSFVFLIVVYFLYKQKDISQD